MTRSLFGVATSPCHHGNAINRWETTLASAHSWMKLIRIWTLRCSKVLSSKALTEKMPKCMWGLEWSTSRNGLCRLTMRRLYGIRMHRHAGPNLRAYQIDRSRCMPKLGQFTFVSTLLSVEASFRQFDEPVVAVNLDSLSIGQVSPELIVSFWEIASTSHYDQPMDSVINPD